MSTVSQPAQQAIEEATSAASITVGPDQQQVFYSGVHIFIRVDGKFYLI